VPSTGKRPAAETATSITLGKEEGVEQTILRREIDEMEASSLSMMPEELEKQVAPQEVADLIAYLREALGPLPPPQIVLFDGEPQWRYCAGENTTGWAAVGLAPDAPRDWTVVTRDL